MSQQLLTLLVPYVFPVIVALSVTICVIAYQHLLRWLPEKQREMLEFAVSRAVGAVEQVMPEALPSDKKQEALARAQQILHNFGLNVPITIIDTAIESSVGALRAIQKANASQISQNSLDVKNVAVPITSAVKNSG